MHDDSRQVEERIAHVVRDRLVPALHRRSAPLTVEAWEVPGEPVPFAEAVVQRFEPFSVGMPWSRPWGTTWFHVTGSVPVGFGASGSVGASESARDAGADGADGPAAGPATGPLALELVVDLGFTKRGPGFQAEGLVYRPDGSIVKALEPHNASVPIPVGPGERIDLYIEAASNPDIGGDDFAGATPLGHPATAGDEPLYVLRRVDVAELDVTVWELDRDVWSLVGLMRELPATQPRRAEILRALERMCDAIDPDDVSGTAEAGRAALAEVLRSPAAASAHRITAVGHAHIDSAWLWPTRETIRKCARTFSNVLALMDEHPDFVFACSSAQQYAWIEEFYPELFERIRRRVAEGRFVPVGGMWVESDTNMPGGEAMVRQFVAGKAFFERAFGVEPREVWLPDSFGYSASMPQISRLAGADSFLTQKISWNETNRMPHHTFFWEGLDGSRIFTHFPPTDTYNSDLSAADLARAERQYAEKGYSNVSMTPFGWGDGGGGPTREMLAAASRTADLEGSPKVTLGTPTAFFDEAKATLPDPAVWSGEMYLELHRGTYTSQARTKKGNRRSEHLLREAELWSATAAARGLLDYPYDALEAIWRTVLLQQFHDILPGSSIAWVYQQAESEYRRVEGELEALIRAALRALSGEGGSAVAFAAAPVATSGVPALAGVAVSGASWSPALAEPQHDAEGWTLENPRLTARFDSTGALVSLIDREAGRELVAPGEVAGLLQVFRDVPNNWDAWDVDRSYRRNRVDLRSPESCEMVDGALEVTHSYRDSTIVQRYRLPVDAASVQIETIVDWHEHHKLLKLAFPVDVRADVASSEIQFGHVKRPIAVNTSWDAARFETVAHRWLHVAEAGFGAVVANGSTYGHDVTRTTRADGGTTTLVRESLLRAPRFPDPEADQGRHELSTAFGPARGILDAVAEGYRLNLPVRVVAGAGVESVEPIVEVSSPSVMVEAVKFAEDRSGDLVVRLYEAAGGRAHVALDVHAAHAGAWRTDLLEREFSGEAGDPWAHHTTARWTAEERIEFTMRPFEIATVRVALRR